MQNIIEITDLKIPELDIYTRLSEVQLLHYYEPEAGIFIAESPKVIGRAMDAGYVPISVLMERRQADCSHAENQKILQRCGEIPIFTAEADVLACMTGFQLTRGMLCAMRRRRLPAVSELCAGAKRIAVLENVMNPTNVGAIFRSAAALNMDGILLTYDCSDPLYRRAARVSMGTVFQVPWTFLEKDVWPGEGIRLLQEEGFRTAAMALCEDSVSVDDRRLKAEEKLAVVLGAEGDGLTKETIACCDYTVRIPMAHGVDSLNVAAASAVAFWELAPNKPCTSPRTILK